MKRLASVALLAGVLPLCAQDGWFPKHNFTIGGGAARPQGDLRGPLSDSGMFSAGYGYRFFRYGQVEGGLDVAFGAAGIRDFLNTGFGYSRIRDRQYFVPFGGRAIMPFGDERFSISGGAGGAWMRYGEFLRQPSDYYRIDCPVCSRRSGWGWYALVNASAFLDRGRHFRLGLTGKTYRGHTEGDALGAVPSFRTKDQWLMLLAEFGVSF